MAKIETSVAEALIIEALESHGVTKENATIVAQKLIVAEIDGQPSHGLSRVAAYAKQAEVGKVNGSASPATTKVAPSFIKVDARNGFAFPAIVSAIDELAELASEQGIAAAAIYNSHHAGQLGTHVEVLAAKGFLALMVANAPKAMAPWGGSSPLFGTNPIAFAAPRRNAPPLVIDLSLSRVARGKVMKAKKLNQEIPDDWAVDEHGNPTTDPAEALKGSMLPAGGAKGAALAMIVEILAATLTGANYSFEASSLFDAEGQPPGLGHFLIAINPKVTGKDKFLDRLELLIDCIEQQSGARIPGQTRLNNRGLYDGQNIDADHQIMEEIKNLTTT